MADTPGRRRRVATFSFKGVVAASTREAAKNMRNAIEHICSTVIDTYKCCMDNTRTMTEKASKLAEITIVEEDLRFIVDFVREETAACKVDRVRIQMVQVAQRMEEEIRILREDLKLVKRDPHLYNKVFDGIIRVLEDNTNFLKLGHSVEQARVLDIAYESVQQIRKVRDATTEDELVDAAQIASNSVVNLLRATKRLVSVQEKTNDLLSGRVDAAQNIMMATLPSFLERCKDKIDLPTDTNLERQQDACQQITSILEEVIAIIKEVKGEYDSSFADQIINDASTDAQKKLASAVKNVTGMLAKLHAAAEDAEKSKLQEDVVTLTKQVAEDLAKQGEDESKIEFVQAVKQGISPAHKDFFQSQKRLSTIAVKATKPQLAVNQEGGSKDMLEAAKDMLSALKGISTSLSDAPALKGVM